MPVVDSFLSFAAFAVLVLNDLYCVILIRTNNHYYMGDAVMGGWGMSELKGQVSLRESSAKI